MLDDLYFKTICNIEPHFLCPMGGLKIEGTLYKFHTFQNLDFLSVWMPSVLGQLQIIPQKDGTYSVHVGDEVWLRSGPTSVQCEGRHHSTLDDTLKLRLPIESAKGSDMLGSWNSVDFKYVMENNSAVNMGIRVYDDVPAAVFSQVLSTFLRLTNSTKKNVNSLYQLLHVATLKDTVVVQMFIYCTADEVRLEIITKISVIIATPVTLLNSCNLAPGDHQGRMLS